MIRRNDTTDTDVGTGPAMVRVFISVLRSHISITI